MERSSMLSAALLIATLTGACATVPATNGPMVQPGAPGEPGRVLGPDDRSVSQPRYTEADVRFMQHMIIHHLQAVEMTALVPVRSRNDDVRRLARRVEASQEDELELMRRWLQARGEQVPDAHAHHGHHGADGHAHMPGMLNPAEMAALAAASGPEFDRLFLEFMIHHHEGALVMVEELLAAEGAGQEAEIFQFAAHVDSDQRIEIERMRRMLATIQENHE